MTSHRLRQAEFGTGVKRKTAEPYYGGSICLLCLCLFVSVGLIVWVGALERGEGGAVSIDSDDAGIGGEIDLEPMRGIDLGNETAVGNARSIAESERASVVLDHGFEGVEALDNPMGDPDVDWTCNGFAPVTFDRGAARLKNELAPQKCRADL